MNARRLFPLIPALLILSASLSGCLLPLMPSTSAEIEARYSQSLSACYAKLEEKFAENRRLFPNVPQLARDVTERDRQFDCVGPLARVREYEQWKASNPLAAYLQENGGGLGHGNTSFVYILN